MIDLSNPYPPEQNYYTLLLGKPDEEKRFVFCTVDIGLCQGIFQA